MRWVLKSLLPLVAASLIALGIGEASASSPGPTEGPQYGLPNSSIQWVHMQAPAPHLQGVWCVVVNGAAGQSDSGAGVTCDWGANITSGNGNANTP